MCYTDSLRLQDTHEQSILQELNTTLMASVFSLECSVSLLNAIEWTLIQNVSFLLLLSVGFTNPVTWLAVNQVNWAASHVFNNKCQNYFLFKSRWVLNLTVGKLKIKWIISKLLKYIITVGINKSNYRHMASHETFSS